MNTEYVVTGKGAVVSKEWLAVLEDLLTKLEQVSPYSLQSNRIFILVINQLDAQNFVLQ